MSDSRFDNRTKDQFKKDIKFGTELESYFFQDWLSIADVHQWSHNGIDNNGEYVESGTNTAGADYRVTIDYQGVRYDNMPLEIKWVPTPGKFTMKIADMRAYVAEDAGILFIYNTNPVHRLRKPKDYNLKKHILDIEYAAPDIRWGIMCSDTVKKLYDHYKDSCYPISYMGNKMGFVIPSVEFHKWFIEEKWENGLKSS